MSTPTAPDWARGYPSKGERIGPAWRAMWAALGDDGWHDSKALAMAGELAGGCAHKTARNLLFAAARAGLLDAESRQDEMSKRWRTWFRRSDESSATERLAAKIEALPTGYNDTSGSAMRRKAVAVVRGTITGGES